MIRVSVVMAIHRVDAYLFEAIHSILIGTEPNIELILISDRLLPFQFQSLRNSVIDPRVVFLKSSGEGAGDARNTGFEYASSSYLAIMDSDDISAPDRIYRQADYLDNNPEVMVVGSQVDYICPHGVLAGHSRYPIIVPRGLLSKPFDSAIANPTAMLRKVALERCGGGYREEFSQSAVEDFELWNRILEIGEIHNLDERLVNYRIHPDQVSQANPDANLFFRRLAIMNDLLGKYGAKQKANFRPEDNSLEQLSSQIAHVRPTIFSVLGRIRFFLFKCRIQAEDALSLERKLKLKRGFDVQANLTWLERFWLVARHPIAFIVWTFYNPPRRSPLGFSDCIDCEGN